MENLKQTLFFDHETEKEKVPSQKIPLLLIHLFISPDNKTKQNTLHLLDLCSFSQRKENPNTHFTGKE